jgi:hypothetical protein
MPDYVVALCHFSVDEFVPYESTRISAENDERAKEKANEWMNKNYALVDDRTWLQVVRGGTGIYSKRLGKS